MRYEMYEYAEDSKRRQDERGGDSSLPEETWYKSYHEG